MPKTFTDYEREYIKKRLMEEAEACLAQYGVRKTTVDELVKRVSIPKGTFYLFYKSKELLFFDVFCAYHDKIQTEIIKQVDDMVGEITEEKVTALIFTLCKKVEYSFLYRLMINGELDLLTRKLPAEVAQAHIEKDDSSMELLLSMMPGVNTEKIKPISAAFRAVCLSMLHRREIGEDVFDEALRMMIRGIVIQMFEEESL